MLLSLLESIFFGWCIPLASDGFCSWQNPPVNLAYVAYGPENAKSPVIFLHAVSASKEQWGELPKTVADDLERKVYAVDARNHGDSPWTDEFNFDLNVDDLLHLMDKLKIDKATLVGCGMGSITSMKTALKEPHRVDKLVIGDMGTKKIDKLIVDSLARTMLFAKQVLNNISSDVDPKTAVKIMLDKVFESLPEKVQSQIKPDIRKRYESTIQVKQTVDGKYASKNNVDVIWKALQNYDDLYAPYNGTYNGPTYFLYGGKSAMKIWENEEEIKKFFPAAEFIKIEDAGYNVYGDEPERFTEALLSSLRL